LISICLRSWLILRLGCLRKQKAPITVPVDFSKNDLAKYAFTAKTNAVRTVYTRTLLDEISITYSEVKGPKDQIIIQSLKPGLATHKYVEIGLWSQAELEASHAFNKKMAKQKYPVSQIIELRQGQGARDRLKTVLTYLDSK
jgi:hypothetical protein